MDPGFAFFLSTALVVSAATVLSLVAMFLKHRQTKAGGKNGDLRQAVALLTETLERQHERQQQILKRLDALEAAQEAPRVALPEEEVDAEPFPVRRRARA